MLPFIKSFQKTFSRDWNTTHDGQAFTENTQQQVWEKAKAIDGHSPDIFRRDVCGAVIHRDDYGNNSSHYGWEIDHIKPVACGGDDELDNLQPLQWRNNRGKGDDYPAEPETYYQVGEEKLYLP